jgi:hypothetical protein
MIALAFGSLPGGAGLFNNPSYAQAPQQKPNIVVIMGDDIGIWNIGAYHRGLMAGKTPNLDAIAKQGMLFTDYYAEMPRRVARRAVQTSSPASCRSARA